MEAEWALPGFIRKLEETTHFLPGREGEGWLLGGVGQQGHSSRNRGDKAAEPGFAGPWEEPGRKRCCNKEGVSQA